MSGDNLQAIAEEWERLPHNPEHSAWKPFTEEVVCQFLKLPVTGAPCGRNPYKTSRQMFRDTARGILRVWTGGSNLVLGHPLGVVNKITGLTLNTMFRAVHDYYGHYVPRNPFETTAGELSAYRAHREMFTDAAIPALFGETIGQLAYYAVRGEFVPEQKAVCFEGQYLGMV